MQISSIFEEIEINGYQRISCQSTLKYETEMEVIVIERITDPCKWLWKQLKSRDLLIIFMRNSQAVHS